jgi:hypothetical protein
MRQRLSANLPLAPVSTGVRVIESLTILVLALMAVLLAVE